MFEGLSFGGGAYTTTTTTTTTIAAAATTILGIKRPLALMTTMMLC